MLETNDAGKPNRKSWKSQVRSFGHLRGILDMPYWGKTLGRSQNTVEGLYILGIPHKKLEDMAGKKDFWATLSKASAWYRKGFEMLLEDPTSTLRPLAC